MQIVQLSQDSSRSVAELYAALADHDRLGGVLGVPVKRIKAGKSAPNGVGSVRRIGMGPLAIEETVVGAVTDTSIDYKITKGGWPLKDHHGRLIFKALPGGGSQVQWRIEFDGAVPGAAVLVKQLLGLAIGRGLRKLA